MRRPTWLASPTDCPSFCLLFGHISSHRSVSSTPCIEKLAETHPDEAIRQSMIKLKTPASRPSRTQRSNQSATTWRALTSKKLLNPLPDLHGPRIMRRTSWSSRLPMSAGLVHLWQFEIRKVPKWRRVHGQREGRANAPRLPPIGSRQAPRRVSVLTACETNPLKPPFGHNRYHPAG